MPLSRRLDILFGVKAIDPRLAFRIASNIAKLPALLAKS